jgi:acyl-CoA synthetase (NDP forming)
MRKTVLAAASVVALGLGGVGVGHAALSSNLAPSSASGKTTLWEQGYGMYATPAQMATVWKEVAHYRQLAAQSQQQRHAQAGTRHETQESFGPAVNGGPV